MIKDWLSSNPDNLFAGKNSTPVDDMRKKIIKAPLYDGEDVGIYHPDNSSIVKIKDNGCIDIFTATNQGIRIDPVKRTINVMTDSELHHLSRYHAWVDGNAKWETHGRFDVISDSDILMETKKNWTINVKGDASINSEKNITLNAEGSIKLNSKEPIYFNAPQYRYD